jgi:glycosyltransferase involved in cell wall biosynthesis
MVKPMSNPVSVVMPAYNAEKYIREAIESIRKQTHQDFELIILDDGSKDRTFDIIRTYCDLDNRICGISQENRGISRTLNRLIDMAHNEWVAIMHADDIALPQRLEKQIAMANNSRDLVACGSYAYHIDESSKILGLSKVGPTTYDEFIEMCNKGDIIQLIHPTMFLKKEAVIKAGGYNPLFDGAEELELTNRLLKIGKIMAIPEPLILYRIHGSSVTMQKFFMMRVFSRYIRACQHARSKGLEIEVWETFKYDYDNACRWNRLKRKIDDLSQFYYRKFAVMISGRKYLHAIQFFLLSVLLNPKYALSRVWNQRLSKQARSFLSITKVPFK